MSGLSESLYSINELEDLSEGKTIIHRLHPFSKILTTIIYLLTVVSINKYNISSLIGFIFYPIILMSLGEIPIKILIKRVSVTIPFILFAGISNILFDKNIAFYFVGIGITYGLISFFSLMIKTILTVTGVLILVGTTPIIIIVNELIKLKVPKIIVTQLLLTYRYMGLLIKEAGIMMTSYKLRTNMKKGIKIKHIGIILGQLLVRSFDRAERIYNCMKCRGFNGYYPINYDYKIKMKDLIYLFLVSGSFILLRFINISLVIGRVFGA